MSRQQQVNNLLQEFAQELAVAEAAHPVWSNDAVHAASILTEEAGEVAQAANDFNELGGRDCARAAMRAEAVQTGAMALRFLLNLDGFECHKQTVSKQRLKDVISQVQQEGGDDYDVVSRIMGILNEDSNS